MTQEKLETKTCPIYETCGQKEENSQKTREVLCEDLYEHCSKYKSVKALENAIFKSYSSIKDELRIQKILKQKELKQNVLANLKTE